MVHGLYCITNICLVIFAWDSEWVQTTSQAIKKTKEDVEKITKREQEDVTKQQLDQSEILQDWIIYAAITILWNAFAAYVSSNFSARLRKKNRSIEAAKKESRVDGA